MIDQTAIAGKLESIKETTENLIRISLSAAKEGRALDTVEQEIWNELIKMGAQLISVTFASLGDGDAGPTIERKNQKPLKRSEQPVRRRYRSVFGTFELERYTYAEHPKRKAERIPFDEQLGLPSHDYSLLLEKWIGARACEDSFNEAVRLLEQMLNTRIPVDSAERVCGRQSELADAFFESLPTPKASEEGQILVQSLDRKGVPIRRDDGNAAAVFGPEERKGAKAGTKKMATVGTVYSVDRHMRSPETILAALFREPKPTPQESPDRRPRPQQRRLRALLPVSIGDEEEPLTLDTVAAMCGWMSEEVTDRKKHVDEIVLLADGEGYLWTNECYFRDDSTRVTEILDLLHVAPRIWECCQHLHGSAPLGQFVRTRLRQVLDGKAASVIRGFRRMATLQKLKGEKRKAIDEACNYLERQLSRMRYDEYLKRGLPIATGTIEGACRYLVKDRMERSGMRWTLPGAQSILNLRSVKTSGLAVEYYEYYRAKRLADRYGKKRRNYADQFELAA